MKSHLNFYMLVKFIYSEKATKFCEIFPLILSYVVPVKSKGKISQNFVAFSEYMNFTGKFEIDFAKVLILMFLFGFAFGMCMMFDIPCLMF